MPRVILVCGHTTHVDFVEGVDYIGVDHGAYVCARQNIPMIEAIGDFDSVTQEEFACIQEKAKTVEKLSTHKDETDTESAILYALDKGYDDILLYGGLGGRIDHEMANLYLLMHRDYPITLVDDHNRVHVFHKGMHRCKKVYTYFSFLPLENCIISLDGFAYPLDHRKLTPSDICTISNEIVADEACVQVHEGRILVMESNDD